MSRARTFDRAVSPPSRGLSPPAERKRPEGEARPGAREAQDTPEAPEARETAPSIRERIGLGAKRGLDVAVAGGLLVGLLPVLMVCAAAVRVSSPGPIIFGHRRCGLRGRDFRCLKFRTMVPDAQRVLARDHELREHYVGNGYKVPRTRDPRITRVGHLLRYLHLDELPQLLNVLRGEMSLVGPRPIVEDELRLYGDRADDLLSVRPGLVGAWTAGGKDRPGYPERVDIELDYVRDRSFLGDLRILGRNLPVLLWGQTDE